MIRKVIIGIIVGSILFISGGLYVLSATDNINSGIEFINELHKVEYLRQEIINGLELVRSDLLLKGSIHERRLDEFVTHAESMERSASMCFKCHHDEKTREKLEHFKNGIDSFMKVLSKIYTLRANVHRMNMEKQKAFEVNIALLEEINDLTVISSRTINRRIASAQESVSRTRNFVSAIVISGPFILLIFVLIFVARFNTSIKGLISTTMKIKQGNLSPSPLDGLYDEFVQVGTAINDMALSLSDQIRRNESLQKRYEMLFKSAGDGIFILDGEGQEAGRIVAANKAAIDMHGYAEEELIGKKILDLSPEENPEKYVERRNRIFAGEWLNFTVNRKRKDGFFFPAEISCGLLEVEGHRYILSFSRDITRRLETERELRNAQQLALVGQMAAGLAHEIKNPLAGIKVSMEVFADELDIDEADRSVFVKIIGEINRVERLLKDLLNYAKPPKPQLSTVDVNNLLQNTVSQMALSLEKAVNGAGVPKKIRFVNELSDTLPRVKADQEQLKQVFLNIFINACDAIGTEGVIRTESSVEDDYVCIRINDSGTGIDQKLMQKIFQPFFSLKSKGTGLGLAISKRLIEEHHGTISAANNNSGGAEFFIRLPLDQPYYSSENL